MQREISNKIELGETLNPLNNISLVSSIDNTSNLKDVFGKVDKLRDLRDKGTADASLIWYIQGLSNVSRQGKILNIVPKKAYTTSTYTDKKTLNMSTTPADRKNANLGEIVTDSLTLNGKQIYYRIPLGFFISLGLVNFPHIFIHVRKQPKEILRNKRKT